MTSAAQHARHGNSLEVIRKTIMTVESSPSRPPTESEGVIEVRHATCRAIRGGVTALSLSVGRGEVYCLLGGPLSGKSMVADLILGFRQPDAGSVAVLGQEPGLASIAIRRLVSFADGRGELYGPLTPLQNLALLCRLGDVAWVHTDGANALRRMGLPDRHLDRASETLPGPSNLAIMLALAWLRRTPVLVLDEPTHGLDTLAIAVFLESLQDFRSTNTTILLTTSDVLVAAKAADRVGILKRGEKVAERRRGQLLQESLTALYADYVGRPDVLSGGA